MRSVPLPAGKKGKEGRGKRERNIKLPPNSERPVQAYREGRGHLRKELVEVFALVVGHIITNVGDTSVNTLLALRCGVQGSCEMGVIGDRRYMVCETTEMETRGDGVESVTRMGNHVCRTHRADGSSKPITSASISPPNLHIQPASQRDKADEQLEVDCKQRGLQRHKIK